MWMWGKAIRPDHTGRGARRWRWYWCVSLILQITTLLAAEPVLPWLHALRSQRRHAHMQAFRLSNARQQTKFCHRSAFSARRCHRQLSFRHDSRSKNLMNARPYSSESPKSCWPQSQPTCNTSSSKKGNRSVSISPSALSTLRLLALKQSHRECICRFQWLNGSCSIFRLN